jgi:hypothetical protein
MPSELGGGRGQRGINLLSIHPCAARLNWLIISAHPIPINSSGPSITQNLSIKWVFLLSDVLYFI